MGSQLGLLQGFSSAFCGLHHGAHPGLTIELTKSSKGLIKGLKGSFELPECSFSFSILCFQLALHRAPNRAHHWAYRLLSPRAHPGLIIELTKGSQGSLKGSFELPELSPAFTCFQLVRRWAPNRAHQGLKGSPEFTYGLIGLITGSPTEPTTGPHRLSSLYEHCLLHFAGVTENRGLEREFRHQLSVMRHEDDKCIATGVLWSP